MKESRSTYRAQGFALGLTLVAMLGCARDAAAQPVAPADRVVLMSTDAIIVAIEAVHAQAEKTLGKRVAIRWGSARGDLKDAILAGESFDVAILLPDVNEQLLKAGKITGESFVIARVDIAIGQRGGHTAIDVSSPEALKRAMLGAKALRWARTGAALFSVNKILDTLDIRSAATAKWRVASDMQLEGDEYELNIYPLSEILTERKELRNLGPLIAPLQVPAVMTAVISNKAADPQGAKALIDFLQGPVIEPMLGQTGFTR